MGQAPEIDIAMKEFATLLYEQWRSTRMLFATAVAVSFAPFLVANLFMLGSATIPSFARETLLFFANAGMFVAHLFWLFMLLVPPGDDGSLRSSMPRYLTQLPVSAVKLAAARMSFGILSSCTLCLVGTLFVYISFATATEMTYPFIGLLLGYSTAYIVFQAIIWWVGPAGTVPTVAVMIGVVVGVPWMLYEITYYFGLDAYDYVEIPSNQFFIDQFAALGISVVAILSFLFRIDFSGPFHPADKDNFIALGVGLTMFTCLLSGAVALAQHRKRRFLGLAAFFAFWRRDRTLNSNLTETFSSKAEALRWFQYRHHARLYPKILAAMFSTIFLLMVSPYLFIHWLGEERIPPLREAQQIFTYTLMVTAVCTVILGTFLSGIIFLSRGWSPLFKKDGVFLFIRPVTTKELITTRWESTAKAAVIGLLPLIVVTVIVSFLDGTRPSDGVVLESTFEHFANRHPIHLILPMGVAAAVYLCVAAWSFLWLENILGMFIVGACIIIPMESYAAFVENEPDNFEMYGFALAGVALYATLSLFLFSNWRKEVLSVKHLLILIALTPIIGTGFLAVANLEELFLGVPGGEPKLATLWIVLPWMMMTAVAPLLTGPAIMHWARHRR